MDNLTNNSTEELTEQTSLQPTEKPKKSGLRVVASISTLIASLSYWAWVGVTAYIVIAGSMGVSDLFGVEGDVLGLLSLTGFLAYIVIGAAILIPAAIAFTLTFTNQKYRRMVKASHNYNPALFGISDGVISKLAYLYGALATFAVLWGIVLLWTGINNLFGYLGIVCLVLQAVAAIVATLEYVLSKNKFNKLPEEEQRELRLQSSVIKTATKKAEKKKRVGKLY